MAYQKIFLKFKFSGNRARVTQTMWAVACDPWGYTSLATETEIWGSNMGARLPLVEISNFWPCGYLLYLAYIFCALWQRVSWHTMHKMLGRSTLKQPLKLGVWKLLGAWHFLRLPPLGDDTLILPMHIMGLSTLTKKIYSERIAFHLTEIWDFKVSKCWRYGLGRSPNLGVVKEANIWKFLDGCMRHTTWQRECTTLTGKVLSAWVLLIRYIHTCIHK